MAKRKNNNRKVTAPADLPKNLHGFWWRRYELFSKFDEGIELSHDMWFSVTPEAIARTIANQMRLRYPNANTVLDAFGGAGGNTIQFVYEFSKVIYVDILEENVNLAMHNSSVYNVNEYISFQQDDFFNFKPPPNTPIDVIFLSPPWGGPSYQDQEVWCARKCEPYPIQDIVKYATSICPNLVLYLPKTTDLDEVSEMIPEDQKEQSSVIYLFSKGLCKAMCVFMGPDMVSI